MQVSFNPYITNQQQAKQPTHKAVIQKYVDIAKKNVKNSNRVYSITLRRIMDGVFFKDIYAIDGIDTLKKIRNFAPNNLDLIDYYIDILRKEL